VGNIYAPRIEVRVQAPGSQVIRPVERERVLEWSFDDDESKADVLKLKIDNHDLRYPDDTSFEHGATIYARWGNAGLGPERVCVVEKYQVGWPAFDVEGHGDGILLNKDKLTEVFYPSGSGSGIKRSDVARLLADRYGYGPSEQFIEDTEETFPSISMRGKTPAQLLRLMAARESKNGIPFVYYVDGTGLHFHPRRIEQPPRREYEFVGAVNGAAGPGKLREFPKFKVSAQAKPGSVKVAGVDPNTGKKVTATASNKDDPGRPGLAPVTITIDKQSGVKNVSGGTSQPNYSWHPLASTSTVATGAQTPAEAKKVAGAALAKSSGMPTEGTVPVDGDPHLTAKIVVKLSRIGTMLSGNYYVKKVLHAGKGGDYTCTLTIVRDGVNRTGAQGAAAQAVQSTAKQNTAAAPAGSGPGAPPKLAPKIQLDQASGVKTVTYVPDTGEGSGT
jgi:hypothetical protein